MQVYFIELVHFVNLKRVVPPRFFCVLFPFCDLRFIVVVSIIVYFCPDYVKIPIGCSSEIYLGHVFTTRAELRTRVFFERARRPLLFFLL